MKKQIRIEAKIPRGFDEAIKKYAEYLEIIETNYSIIYNTESTKYIFNNEYMGLGAFKLLSQVKADVRHNIEERKFKVIECKPQYFGYNPKLLDSKDGKFFMVNELDLNSAYLESAYFQKIISDKIYLRLKEVSKKMRLKALGSLATRKIKSIFIKGEKQSQEVIIDNELSMVWQMICKGTDELIYNYIYAYEKAFLFYWFDNLFLQQQLKEDKFYKQKYPLTLNYSKDQTAIKFLIEETKKTFTIPF